MNKQEELDPSIYLKNALTFARDVENNVESCSFRSGALVQAKSSAPKVVLQIENAINALAEREKQMIEIQKLVNKQADDEGLWAEAQHISEGYIQTNLRKLHAVIENTTIFGTPKEQPRCPTCGRDVANIFEHVDQDCENWGDRASCR